MGRAIPLPSLCAVQPVQCLSACKGRILPLYLFVRFVVKYSKNKKKFHFLSVEGVQAHARCSEIRINAVS